MYGNLCMQPAVDRKKLRNPFNYLPFYERLTVHFSEAVCSVCCVLKQAQSYNSHTKTIKENLESSQAVVYLTALQSVSKSTRQLQPGRSRGP